VRLNGAIRKKSTADASGSVSSDKAAHAGSFHKKWEEINFRLSENDFH
jgi:hypothetical protein